MDSATLMTQFSSFARRAGIAITVLLACATNAIAGQDPLLDAHPLSLVEDIEFSGPEVEGFHDCFWIGPVSYQSYNIAYPDEGAVYWGTSFQLPANASHLEIAGGFPQARYMSYHAYDKLTQPTDALLDKDLAASKGTNPFAKASSSGGHYLVKVVNGNPSAMPSTNTLYLGDEQTRNDRLPLILRIYAPATGTDFTGDAGLPQTTLVLNDGSRLQGKAMCHAINSPIPGQGARAIPSVAMEQEVWQSLQSHPRATPGFPAQEKIEWLKFWGGAANVARNIPGRAFLDNAITNVANGQLEKRSGFYANKHNEYVSAFINEQFGELVVLRGKMPSTPANGWDISEDGYDLRYWSLCTNESLVTTAYADCVFDSDVATDKDRNYTIVISKASNRPSNARRECGVTWLDWGARGDGAGDPAFGNLLLRNMLGEDFPHSVQNVRAMDSVKQDMGAYYPDSHYQNRPDFESLGCPGS